MKNYKATILATVFLFSGVSYAGDEISAFNSGIGAAVKVIQYEAKASRKPISDGGRFCVSLLTKSREAVATDEDAIRLESLGLVALNTRPSYYKKGAGGERLLCLLRGRTQKSVQKRLDSIRNDFPKIDDYFPHIVKMSSYDNFKRIVPVVGEIHKDESSTIESLSLRIAAIKKKVLSCENNKDMMKSAFKKMVDSANHLFSGDPGIYKSIGEKDDTVIIPKKKAGFSPHIAGKPESIVYENGDTLIRRGSKPNIMAISHKAKKGK